MRSRFAVGSVLVLLSTFVTLGPAGGRPVAASCSPEHYIKTDAGPGGVQVAVTYVTPEYVAMTRDRQGMKRYQPDRYALFLVQFDSHSVDISGYNPAQSSRISGGRATNAPGRWEETTAGTHHRSGVLIFPRIAPRLPVQLVVKGLAGVPARTFRWQP